MRGPGTEIITSSIAPRRVFVPEEVRVGGVGVRARGVVAIMCGVDLSATVDGKGNHCEPDGPARQRHREPTVPYRSCSKARCAITLGHDDSAGSHLAPLG
ncbi:hypothetical protein CP877_06360 [Cutibacterium modestum]|nr:hypothetical protein CP877_06360 [Cutibacterium modestum]